MCVCVTVFFLNCMLFITGILTSTLVLGINYFVIITRPLCYVRCAVSCAVVSFGLPSTYNDNDTYHFFPDLENDVLLTRS